MMTSGYIIDVSESDFEYQVIAYSQETPVIVDFWAEWCGPCRTIGPMLERMAEQAQGGFRLAKVNVDENPNLARQFNVRSIPAVKAFRGGAMVAEFNGVIPEIKLRDFIRSLAPSQNQLAIEKGLSLLAMGRAAQAEEAFRQALEIDADDPAALLGLAKSTLMQGHSKEANLILRNFPASKELKTAEILRPLAETMAKFEANFAESEDSLEIAFNHSLRLVLRGNFEAAMDGFLDILRQDKRFHDGLARKMILSILELPGEENEITRQYRNELMAVLF